MKTLILVRHAKSSWENLTQSDFDRPLNERGKKDAPVMAERLKEKEINVDLFVSSPAKRARKTARIFAEAYGKKKEDLVLVDNLYEASLPAFESAVAGLDDSADVVALFAHNPGITQYGNTLSNVRIDDMPTCGVFAVSADTGRWADFKEATKKFLFFDYPKNPLEGEGL